MTAAVKLQETEWGNSLVEPRIERIFGTEYAMSSPSFKHQTALLAIGIQLSEKLQSNECVPLVAPFDVYPLFEKGDMYTVVQPDVFLACDRSKLKNNSYNGAPKLIVEILSTNRSHDMVTKLNLYEKAGVSEYWIVDTDAEVVTVLQLTDNGYITRAYTGESEVQLATVPGCTVDFKKVFSQFTETAL